MPINYLGLNLRKSQMCDIRIQDTETLLGIRFVVQKMLKDEACAVPFQVFPICMEDNAHVCDYVDVSKDELIIYKERLQAVGIDVLAESDNNKIIAFGTCQFSEQPLRCYLWFRTWGYIWSVPYIKLHNRKAYNTALKYIKYMFKKFEQEKMQERIERIERDKKQASIKAAKSTACKDVNCLCKTQFNN